MIVAQHKVLAHALFKPYLKRLLRKHFRAIQLPESILIDPSRSLLVLGNHFSWWDGFIHYHLNQQVFGKTFHLMMLEEQLRKYWFFKHLGAFSIQQQSRSVLSSLNYATELLQEPGNMVLIFPQGVIESQYVEIPKFEKGILRVLEKAHSNTQICFVTAFTEYGSYPKPTLSFEAQAFNK